MPLKVTTQKSFSVLPLYSASKVLYSNRRTCAFACLPVDTSMWTKCHLDDIYYNSFADYIFVGT